jgi:hypothetical protein
MQLFILRNFIIPSPTVSLLGARVLFGTPFTVACKPQVYKPIQLYEIIVKEMDPDVTKKKKNRNMCSSWRYGF